MKKDDDLVLLTTAAVKMLCFFLRCSLDSLTHFYLCIYLRQHQQTTCLPLCSVEKWYPWRRVCVSYRWAKLLGLWQDWHMERLEVKCPMKLCHVCKKLTNFRLLSNIKPFIQSSSLHNLWLKFTAERYCLLSLCEQNCQIIVCLCEVTLHLENSGFQLHNANPILFPINREMSWWSSNQSNMINGTDGAVFHPLINRNELLYIFAADLCRYSDELTLICLQIIVATDKETTSIFHRMCHSTDCHW